MGINIFRWIRGHPAEQNVSIDCSELMAAAQEYQIRELCFWTCVDIVANCIGRCDFRTYRDGEEIFGREHYVWNYEPNPTQNSTAFLHKLVARLFEDNEALIVGLPAAGGGDALYVADDWHQESDSPSVPTVYNNVRIGSTTYARRFAENDVIHVKLNHVNMRPVVDGLYQSYYRLCSAAMKAYEFERGQHWKVHVSQMAQGDPQFVENFSRMIREQVKPFFESNGAILPEFEGYTFTNEGGRTSGDSRDIRSLVEDIFDFTARGFLIPAVLINGKVEGVANANERFLTYCIDPICDQLAEEITRKRYGFDAWSRGEYMRVDSTSIEHFDMFANAANVEKLVGSGAYSINEVRRGTGQAPISEDWADRHYLTLNIGTATERTQYLGKE